MVENVTTLIIRLLLEYCPVVYNVCTVQNVERNRKIKTKIRNKNDWLTYHIFLFQLYLERGRISIAGINEIANLCTQCINSSRCSTCSTRWKRHFPLTRKKKKKREQNVIHTIVGCHYSWIFRFEVFNGMTYV